MASSSEHYAQAQSNEGFYENLGAERSTTPEWAMTVLFYSALHYAQAAFVYLNPSELPSDHGQRKKAIRTQFRNIATEYEALYDASRRARYDCIPPEKQELSAAQKRLRKIAEEIATKAPPVSYA